MDWETYDQITGPDEMTTLATPLAIGATAMVVRRGGANPYIAAMVGLLLMRALKRARHRLHPYRSMAAAQDLRWAQRFKAGIGGRIVEV